MESKMDYLQFMYGEKFSEWDRAGYEDDRRLYVNTYKMIYNSLQYLLKAEREQGIVTPVYIRTAINKNLDADYKTLDYILGEFLD